MAFRQDRSYIAISCRDSSSSLCTAYMEHIEAMDPLVGEAVAATHAVELALQFDWPRVRFESDCKLLCDDIMHVDSSPCKKIADLIDSLRCSFKA